MARGLEAAFIRERPPPVELRELSSRLRHLTDALPSLAKRSAALALPREDLPGMPPPKRTAAPPKSAEPHEPCLEPSLLPPEWIELTASLSLRPSEMASDDAARLEEARWELMRRGWLPALRSLCLVLSDIQRLEAAAAEEEEEEGAPAAGGSTAVSGGRSRRAEAPKAPTDLLSLRTLCHIHAALEVLVVWGIAKRLATPSAGEGTASSSSGTTARRRAYGVLLPPTRPLSKTVAGALQNAQRVLQLRPSGGGDGGGEEVPHLRRLRLWFCAVVLERTLRITQLRPLLLPRYLPDLIAALLDLSQGGGGVGGGDGGGGGNVGGGSGEVSSEARRLDSVATEWAQGCLLNLLGQSQTSPNLAPIYGTASSPHRDHK